METPGAYLKREREIRGIDLKDISEITKISVKTLKAIEAEEFDSLPPPIFVKGFIRSYSKCIGIDGNDAVLHYEAYLKEIGWENKEEEEKAKEKNKGWSVQDERGFRYFNLGLIALLLIILSASIYIYLHNKKGENVPEKVPEKAGAVGVADLKPDDVYKREEVQGASRTDSGKVEDEMGYAAIDNKELTLDIVAHKLTWMRIKIDEKRPFEVLLNEGERVSWKATRIFSLIIGNAAGIDAIFNGKPLGRLGKEGEVVRISLPLKKEDSN